MKNLLIKTIQVFIIDVHTKDLTNLDLGTNLGHVKKLRLMLNQVIKYEAWLISLSIGD